jgi:uncharacterized iron-regulated protein
MKLARHTILAAAIHQVSLFVILLLVSLPVLPAVVDEFLNARVIQTEKIASMPGLTEEIKGRRVVFVGETHSSVEDHMLQMHVLETMYSQGWPLAIGVEWFQQPFQAALDQYIAGDIDERQLLRDTEYYRRWGFDYRLYRPVMRFARKHGIPVRALNIEREITDSIMRNGLEGLSDDAREKLPQQYDFAESAYTRMLQHMFGDSQETVHGASPGFQRFLEVQLTWDEVMAESVAKYLAENRQSRLLVLAGRGHVHPGAIPARLQRRTGISGLSMLNFNPTTPFNHADYLVLGLKEELPPVGSLGIAVTDRGGMVYVTEPVGESRAVLSGLEKGDRILAINDTVIESLSDMKYELIDRMPGEEVMLLLLRRPETADEQAIRVRMRLMAPGKFGLPGQDSAVE